MNDDLEKTLDGSFCPCFNVSYNEISILVLNMKNINTIEDLQRYILVCKRCNLCCNDIQKIIDFYRKT